MEHRKLDPGELEHAVLERGPQPEDAGREGPTPVIEAGAAFDGLLAFRGHARVDGVLRGTVVAEGCLVLGEGAQVDAQVEVDELVVGGFLRGEVEARQRVELLPTARVAGSVRTPRLLLAEGCEFEGHCETRTSDGE